MSNEKNDIEKYMKMLNLNCSRCLDTKILWKGRDNVAFARMDGRGDYDVLNCDKCNNGNWNRCSSTTEIFVNNIHAFHKADGDWHVLETLKKMVKPILDLQEKEEMKIDLEKMKHDEVERQSIEQIENDMNPEPMWSYYKKDNINKEIKSADIDIEIGKITTKVCEAIKASHGDIIELVDLIKELKLDLKMSMETSHTNKKEIKQVKDSNNKFTYIILIFSNDIIKSNCMCLEWCGFNNRTNKFSLQYTIIKPKNKAAQRECEKHMSNNIKLN
jgi:hypothetical protein